MQSFILAAAIHLYSGLLHLLRLVAGILAPRIRRLREWEIGQRLRTPYAERDCRNVSTVWVHAASLGEAKLMYRFIEVLRDKHPDDVYVVTAATRSGVDFLTTHKPECIAAVGFLPLDTIGLMEGMLHRFGIHRVWLAETELWPSMLWICRRAGVPVGVFNGRIEESSFVWFRRFGWILRPLFSWLDPVLAQNPTYAQRFEALGVSSRSLHVVGNIKAQVQVRRPDRSGWRRLRSALSIGEDDIVLTAGCVHPGEGAVIREALSLLAEQGFACRCVVVPRHREAAQKVLEELGSGVLHLRELHTSRTWNRCLVDRYGVMDDMYSMADIAFVGGTFVSVGGHNVWDAARYGIPVLFGPDYHTQKAGCERLKAGGVGFEVADAPGFAQAVVRVLKTQARAFIAAQQAFADELGREGTALHDLVP